MIPHFFILTIHKDRVTSNSVAIHVILSCGKMEGLPCRNTCFMQDLESQLKCLFSLPALWSTQKSASNNCLQKKGSPTVFQAITFLTSVHKLGSWWEQLHGCYAIDISTSLKGCFCAPKSCPPILKFDFPPSCPKFWKNPGPHPNHTM